MVVESENYKLKILEYAVEQSIDGLLPKNSEDALGVILHQSNEVVWRIATDIYTNSGHKLDFMFIRDILNSRIEPLKNKATKEKIKAELKSKKLAEIAERERLEKEKKEEEKKKSQKLEVFIRIRNIIIEQLLDVKEEQVQFDAIFENFMPESYDDYRNRIRRENTWCSSSWAISDRDSDSIGLIMALEEEFDIEIDDQELDYTNLPSWNVGQLVELVMQKI